MNTQNNGNNGKKDDGNKGRGVVTRILLTLILFFIVMISYMFISAEIDKIRNREITYDEFLTMLEGDTIEKVVIEADYDKIAQGDRLELAGVRKAVEEGKTELTVVNKTNGAAIPVLCELAGRTKDIMLAGGLLDYTREALK